jgi:hypothetical protein
MNPPGDAAAVNATQGHNHSQQPQAQNDRQQHVRFAESGQQTQPSATINNTHQPSSAIDQNQ